MNERFKIEFVVGNKNFWGQEIRKKGRININKLYEALVPWFHEYKYVFIEKGITGKEKSDGREEKMEWASTRKVDSYFQFHIDLNIMVFRARGGKAEVTITFKGYLEKDYKNNFSRKYGKFGEILRRVYERYIIKDKVEKMMGKVYGETSDFIDKTKKSLDLITR